MAGMSLPVGVVFHGRGGAGFEGTGSLVRVWARAARHGPCGVNRSARGAVGLMCRRRCRVVRARVAAMVNRRWRRVLGSHWRAS